MYGKVYDSIYDGTLYGHWEAIVTMQQLIVLASPDGVVDMTPQAICARTSIPIKIIAKGLKQLSEPDPYTRTPGEEGRRIVLLDDHRPWGWRLVNHGKYMRLRNMDEKREADRVRIAEKRAGALPAEKPSGYVYFATTNNGHIKIGFSKNPWARIKDLQIGSAAEVKLLCATPGTHATEAALHKEFKDDHVGGEWYRRSTTLMQRIESIKSNKNNDVAIDGNYVANVAHSDSDLDSDSKDKNIVGQKPDPARKEIKEQALEILKFLNEKAGKNYQPVKTNIDLIAARLKEGGTVADMRAVIAKKCREWNGRDGMDEYLRPATLFGAKNFWQKYQGELAAPEVTNES